MVCSSHSTEKPSRLLIVSSTALTNQTVAGRSASSSMRGLLVALHFLLSICSVTVSQSVFDQKERVTCTVISRNNDTFTYHWCHKVTRSFEESFKICRDSILDGELASLPSEADYDRLIAGLADKNQTFKFFLGLRQRESTIIKSKPETGVFYWLNNVGAVITNTSKDSYWQPFSKWIIDFDSLPVDDKRITTLVMSAAGDVSGGYSFGETLTSFDLHVVCINRTQVKVEEFSWHHAYEDQDPPSKSAAKMLIWQPIVALMIGLLHTLW